MPHAAAYAALSAGAPLVPFSLERREPGPEDVLIDILYCGICHSDLHQVRDEWGGSIFPMVPGHEMVGTVAQVGSAVSRWRVGDTVGVGCMVDSCRTCAPCREGEEQFCDQGPTWSYNCMARDGSAPTQGGYATRITVDQAFVVRIPQGLALDAAAPLLCAGITTYSPLRRFQVGPGDPVAILGLGGLGHMGVKLAKAMGAKVTVLSHSEGKRQAALDLGADDFVVTSDPTAFTRNAKRFSFILDTVSAAHDYNGYLGMLRREGTMVLVGIPEPTALAAFPLVAQGRRLAGSLIGGIRETQEMLDFCAAHGVAADIEVIPMEQVNAAYERMLRSDVRYRFVIDLASLR